jgi:hypothetical protein
MSRVLALALAAGVLLGAPGEARAGTNVLPPESSGALLRALSPFALETEVAKGWRLTDVEVRADRAELILAREEKTARLLLIPKDASLGTGTLGLGETRSFQLGLSAQETPSTRLLEAANALAETLRAADTGTFYKMIEETPGAGNSAWGGKGEEPVTPPLIPVTWTLLLGWALGLSLLAWGVRRLRASDRAAVRIDALVALGLTAGAAALRAAQSPMTLLHENTRGTRDLEAIAEMAPLLRPMGGTLGVQRLLADLAVAPSVSSWAWTNLLWSSLTVGAVYGLLRVLRAGRLASVAGAATLGTLPLAIRISGCEDAFPGAVAHLVVGTLLLAAAARVGSLQWLVSGAVFVALAGVFRPSQYAAIAFFLPWALAMAEPGSRRALLRPLPLGLAGLAFALIVAPDLGAMVSERGGSSALTVGWWSRPGIHSWPLFDPEVSPVWWMPLMAVGLVLAVRDPRTRMAAAGLFAYAFAMSFLLSCDYGWPSSLRRALSQAWVPAALIGLGLSALPAPRVARWASWAVLAACLLTPLTHGEWTARRYGQQEALDAQGSRVLPHLLAQDPGLIITPWPTLDEMSGTLLTLPLREAGWRVASLDEGRALLAGPDRAQEGPVYWYRSMACWARKVRGGREDTGLHRACQAMERAGSWRPEVVFDVSSVSDSDALWLGDGGPSIELGLFRLDGR